MGRFLLGLALACSSGCALSMNAIANHNSRGTACLDSTAFGFIDLAIAGASAAAISASDASAGWYAVPGLLGASGLLGIISAERCKADADGEASAASNAPPASNTAPSFGDAPVDPDARDVTREEMGFSDAPPQPAPPDLRIDHNGLPTTLPPPPPPTPPPVVKDEPKKPPSVPQAPTCTLHPRKDCPDGYYCQLVEENTGTCVKIE